MIDKRKLESFLQEVRGCTDCKNVIVPCEAGTRCTPFVYGKTTSDILVVSEAPPPKAWRDNRGQMWERTLEVTQEGTDVQSKLARWLDIVSEAKERLFWIQRANCCVTEDWDRVYKHCGNKFLPSVIELVKPKLIVTLGGKAAGYFYDFKSMKGLMKRCLERGPKHDRHHQSYDVLPFYHPAGRAEKWRQASIGLHRKMEKHAREKVRRSN